MNSEQISNAMDSIDDDMLDHTTELRRNGKPESVRHFIPKVAVAILAICIVGGASVYALGTGGYFRDERNIAGAVTGQTYENATEEIVVEVVNQSEIYIEFLDYDNPPYTLPETAVDIYLTGYRITNASGEEVLNVKGSQKLEISDGVSSVSLDCSSLPAGSYTLIIDGFTVKSKADQPLTITGDWSAGFVIG